MIKFRKIGVFLLFALLLVCLTGCGAKEQAEKIGTLEAAGMAEVKTPAHIEHTKKEQGEADVQSKLVNYSNISSALLDLRAGKLKGLVLEGAVADYVVHRNPDFAAQKDYRVVDFSMITMEKNQEVYEILNSAIVAMKADGTLDRARLGEIVFSSEEKLELLNKTVLSRVIARIKQMIFEYEKSGYRAVAVDAPTLIESGFDKECDTVISVLSPKEQRTERIMKRDSIDAERAVLRVNAQKDDSFYTESSHFVLHNDGERDSFEKAAAELLSSLDLI